MRKALLLLLLLTCAVFAEKAGLVIQYDASNAEKKCVEFNNGDSAYSVLRNSGAEMSTREYPGIGIALCSIWNTGCKPDNCFCNREYWSFHRLVGGEWNYSEVGVGDYKVLDGDVIGFRWGVYGDRPDMHSFEELCGNKDAVLISPGNSQIGGVVLIRVISNDGEPLAYEKVLVQFPGGKKELITNESGEATFTAENEGIHRYSVPGYRLSSALTTTVRGAAPAVGMAIANPAPLVLGISVIIILALIYISRRR